MKGNGFKQNSERVERQKDAPLKVIFGNPPYSVGQRSANDNAQNQKYERLDDRISDTYAKLTSATNKNSLYDSYFKAFRWSADRLDDNGGVICFVSNGSWIDGNAQDGFRKSLEKEFSSIYVFNLRGNQRTSGELSRKEGGKIFGSGSRTPIAITLLVKKPKQRKTEEKAIIYYHDIGDYLKREDKLSLVQQFKSVEKTSFSWTILEPNKEGDWISHRNESFQDLFPLGSTKKFEEANNSIFLGHSCGVQTNRDAWVYNFSSQQLKQNVGLFVELFNNQLDDFAAKIETGESVGDFIEKDEKQIKWSSSLIDRFERGHKIEFSDTNVVQSMYRPFVKEWLYFSGALNHRPYQIPRLFPKGHANNLLICLPGSGTTTDFSAIITRQIPDLEINSKSQCFPLYYYELDRPDTPTLFDTAGEPQYVRRDGVSDFIAKRAKEQYGVSIKKEDIFYYVYGFLHSPEYRVKFANDLKKMLPRIPLVDELKDFVAFAKAGRNLAKLHLEYESVAPHPDVTVTGDETGSFRVGKMRFPAKDRKDTIIYNGSITVSNIPADAYKYVINGKSAIEWIMERYAVKTDPASQITNDPNNWSEETGNDRYILDLLLSIVNVSTQTVEIVDGLPKPNFD